MHAQITKIKITKDTEKCSENTTNSSPTDQNSEPISTNIGCEEISANFSHKSIDVHWSSCKQYYLHVVDIPIINYRIFETMYDLIYLSMREEK